MKSYTLAQGYIVAAPALMLELAVLGDGIQPEAAPEQKRRDQSLLAKPSVLAASAKAATFPLAACIEMS